MSDLEETPESPADPAPAPSSNSGRNRKLGAIAVAVVALVGVGTAIAASKLHSGSSSTSRAFGPGGRGMRFGPGMRAGSRPRGFGPMLGLGGGLSGASTYLGISESQLQTDIQSGKTLAQIADATSGKSASGLIAALVADEKTRLAAAVKNGRIPQNFADRIAANLTQIVTALANGNGFGGRSFGGPPPGGGFGGGPPGQQSPPSSGKVT